MTIMVARDEFVQASILINYGIAVSLSPTVISGNISLQERDYAWKADRRAGLRRIMMISPISMS